MRLEFFPHLPECAREIRKKVFIDEQGFTIEFDEKDDIAVHLVAFDEDGAPVATCRIFKGGDIGGYVLGRVAVIKQYRGKQVGLALLNEAERYVKQNGGKCIIVLAQQRVTDFYEKAGFKEFGNVEYDEGCPHVRMKKYI